MNEFIEVIETIDLAVLLPFIVIQLLLLVIALIDWFRVEETNGPKWLWLLIIVFVNMIGPILYFIIGRRRT
ncbi:PLD nuclease N-terminal domain-containing protein [Desertibacillus haloalkaliphilus]|uniref:PLD nuclease N-terminal domain-containing protein n=1 Tax=Desertibacillus haloalkaliphilus TaxID=1328930 RepID=UPI001C269966|nr:PLD nuclease N-terminal domain-containing protein [Desertibacillus haloalkaliphilus]MBU8907536.1 PLD nuclease N-terminal domain-containing protein [Desertibacillus haloalkaliphilus]